jgi:hypothetical protein
MENDLSTAKVGYFFFFFFTRLFAVTPYLCTIGLHSRNSFPALDEPVFFKRLPALAHLGVAAVFFLAVDFFLRTAPIV